MLYALIDALSLRARTAFWSRPRNRRGGGFYETVDMSIIDVFYNSPWSTKILIFCKGSDKKPERSLPINKTLSPQFKVAIIQPSAVQ